MEADRLYAQIALKQIVEWLTFAPSHVFYKCMYFVAIDSRRVVLFCYHWASNGYVAFFHAVLNLQMLWLVKLVQLVCPYTILVMAGISCTGLQNTMVLCAERARHRTISVCSFSSISGTNMYAACLITATIRSERG